MPVILGVDASRAVGRRTGVGRQVQHMLRCWADEPTLPFSLLRVFTPSALPDFPEDGRFEQVVLAGRGGGLLWQMRRLRAASRTVDVLYAPYTLPPGFGGVGVVNNLGIYEGEHAFRNWRAGARSRHMAYSARKATVVIANSRSTRSDVIRYYRVPKEKVVVIWPGVAEYFHPGDRSGGSPVGGAAAQYFGSPAPYFLVVGKLSVRRHVGAVIEAFRSVHHHFPGYRLLVVGPNVEGTPLEARVKALGLGEAVRHVEFVEHEKLADIYRDAFAFVLPTEHEGFSFTILEALASGCPVVTVEHAALHEASIGTATLTVPRPEPDLLAAALVRLISDERLRADLRERGLRVTRSLSWAETARKTMSVLGRVAVRAA
jgi:glycosyltransferase involved in cell wall biosynthesis